MVANFADDAGGHVTGRAGRARTRRDRRHCRQAIPSEKVSDAKLNIASVDVTGDYAIETGSYEVTVTSKGGKPMPDKGKYLTVWKTQVDGSWKIYRDITNSDGPFPKS